MMPVDDAFLERWCPLYINMAPDQKKYKRILALAKKDYKATGSLAFPTLLEIVRWKSPRPLRHFLKHRNGTYYFHGIRACLLEEDDRKLPALCELDGIEAAMASAILHFVFPRRFPIIDFRTVEALHQLGYIEFSRASKTSYGEFRNAILDIRKATGGQWSLRDIDMALFAYHKQALS